MSGLNAEKNKAFFFDKQQAPKRQSTSQQRAHYCALVHFRILVLFSEVSILRGNDQGYG